MRIGIVWASLLLTASVVVLPARAATNFVVADVQNPDHPVVQALNFMAKTLADKSKGDMTMTVKPNSELGNETQEIEQARAGKLAMARVSMSELARDVPSAKLLTLPYLFRSRDHMWHVLDGDFGKQLRKEVEASGVIVLTFFDSGTRNFYTTKKPIRTRSDFEGQRIRVQPSPVFQDLITELGGTPVVLAYGKVPDALRSGEIDGAENNLPSFVGADHYKYARYLSMDEHSMVPDVLLMSKKVWDGLKPQQQATIMESAAASSEFMGKLWQEKEQEAIATAKKAGVVIIPKSQLSITGIEAFAVKLYTKYVTNDKDLETVLKIVSAK